MAVIALTGSSGFIGRHLRHYIVERGHSVVPLGRGDIGRGLCESLAGADCVIHLAGRAHVLDERESDPAAAFHAANVSLTHRVMEAASSSGVRRFVFMSSAGVLGNTSPPGGFTDESPPHPYDNYTRSKLDAERWLLAEADARVAKVILRPPVVYGPGARGNFGRIVRAAAIGWPLPFGDLRAPRSMVGLRNLCDLTLTAVLDSRAAGATFLVSDEETMSVRDLTVALRRLFGRSSSVPAIPARLIAGALRLLGRNADAQRLTLPFELRSSRARELLGWRPPYTCAEELAWTVAQIRVGGARK